MACTTILHSHCSGALPKLQTDGSGETNNVSQTLTVSKPELPIEIHMNSQIDAWLLIIVLLNYALSHIT